MSCTVYLDNCVLNLISPNNRKNVILNGNNNTIAYFAHIITVTTQSLTYYLEAYRKTRTSAPQLPKLHFFYVWKLMSRFKWKKKNLTFIECQKIVLQEQGGLSLSI